VPPKNVHTPASSGPSDAALVVAARAGEAWAQEALFRRYARLANGLAYRLMGRDEDVDDLVQDSFMHALRGLDSLTNPQAFSSWFGSIVVRTAHKLLRRRSLMGRLGLRRGMTSDPDEVISRTASPEVHAELNAVYRVLDKLPAEARIALVLNRVEGMSVPEIAERMEISISTVKRRLGVAEKRLGQWLDQQRRAS
jgi:RNA polymerase sigma-70 factor, ECF subfamily